MAALLGYMEFWNATAETVLIELKKQMQVFTSTGDATVMGICCLLFSVITVVGNSLVIAAVWKDPLKVLRSSPTNLILLEMAIADLFVGLVFALANALFYLRLALEEDAWRPLFGVMMMSNFFMMVSVFHVFLLTIDRYYALAKPLKYRSIVTKRRVAIASLSIWAICFCFFLVPSILQTIVFALWFIFVVLVWVSSEGIACTYVITLRNLLRHSKTRMNEVNSQSNQALFQKRERKVFVVILSVILAFYFCFVPWIAGQFLFLFCQVCHSNKRIIVVWFHFATILSFANSALNPLLYAWRFSKFQATFKYFWTKCSCCSKILRRRKTINISSGSQSQDSRL